MRNELLGAVDGPAVALAHRRGPHRAGVAAGGRLGESPRGEALTLRQRREVLALLFVGAEHRDVRGPETVVRGDRQAHGRVDSCQLFDRDAVVNRRHGGTAEFLGKLDSHEPQRRELRDELLRKELLFIPLHDMRANFGLRELADTAAQQLLLVSQPEVHSVLDRIIRV
jgi:hypothetical protein